MLVQFGERREPVGLNRPHGEIHAGRFGNVGGVLRQTGRIEAHREGQRVGVVTTASRYRVEPCYPFLALVHGRARHRSLNRVPRLLAVLRG